MEENIEITYQTAKLQVGNKIRGVRELQGLSQEYVAGKLNISQTSLSKIETGETGLTFERLFELSKVLSVDVNMILNFDKDVIFNNCQQSGMHNQYTFHDSDLREVYDKLLDEKDQRIKLLEKLVPKD